MCFDAHRPDAAEQLVIAAERRVRFAVVAALNDFLLEEAHLVRRCKDVDFDESSAPGGEREEFLAATARDVVVEVA